jgi:hypothetical protein
MPEPSLLSVSPISQSLQQLAQPAEDLDLGGIFYRIFHVRKQADQVSQMHIVVGCQVTG